MSERDEATEESTYYRLSRPVLFRCGSTTIQDESLLDEIATSLVPQLQSENLRVQRLEILGISSPDGSVSANRQLARRRAQVLEEKIDGLLPDPIRPEAGSAAIATADGYSYLLHLMEESDDPDYRIVKGIIEEHAGDAAAIQQAMKAVGGKKSPMWNRLKLRYFPKLRSAMVLMSVEPVSEEDVYAQTGTGTNSEHPGYNAIAAGEPQTNSGVENEEAVIAPENDTNEKKITGNPQENRANERRINENPQENSANKRGEAVYSQATGENIAVANHATGENTAVANHATGENIAEEDQATGENIAEETVEEKLTSENIPSEGTVQEQPAEQPSENTKILQIVNWTIIIILLLLLLLAIVVILMQRRDLKRAQEKEAYYKTRVSAPATQQDRATQSVNKEPVHAAPATPKPADEAVKTEKKPVETERNAVKTAASVPVSPSIPAAAATMSASEDKITAPMYKEPHLPEKQANLRKLIQSRAEMEQPFKTPNQIASFMKEFNEAYPGYMQSLKETHPDLTNSDELVLAFMINDLSIQQICTLLESKPRTIWSRRLRIKNHLGLTTNDDLDEWVHNSIGA